LVQSPCELEGGVQTGLQHVQIDVCHRIICASLARVSHRGSLCEAAVFSACAFLFNVYHVHLLRESQHVYEFS
jgi:hypothetical protein